MDGKITIRSDRTTDYKFTYKGEEQILGAGKIISIAKNISAVCPNAIYIIVANPVDILTHAFIKATNIPANRVLGSGTSLDTARLKAKLAQIFKVSIDYLTGLEDWYEM